MNSKTHIDCPDPSRLRRLVQGSLAVEDANTLEQHLQACSACQRVVSAIRAETVTLRSSSADDLTAVTIPSSDYDYLGPPSRPGELGSLGPYRVLRVLGEGGMGTVFEAEDPKLERRVALKVLKASLAADPNYRERFLREARAAASVQHEHVVAVYQVDEDRGVPYLSMPLLAGESLYDRILRDGRLPPTEVARIGRETAEGLAAAHARGLVHRDIKPGNLWLEGERGRVRILDFGLARTNKSGVSKLTEAGLVVGTPQYLAPEQARGWDVDHRTDLFALGIVLYQALAGQLPFEGKDTMAVLTALAVDEPPPLQQLAPDVPPELAAIVHHLLAKKPDQRPSSAREVADRLALLAGEPSSGPRTAIVQPPPPSRRRWLAWTVGLAATVGLLGLGGRFLDGRLAGPIWVGILHSQTGTMAPSEQPVIDATLLAISEINARGGVLGRRLEPIVVDGASDPDAFRAGAEHLVRDDAVAVVFGCWTSASRKTVKPIFEQEDHLLAYPVQYEGLEQSPNILYLGAVPNQQIIPAVRWAIDGHGKRKLFLVGSDYIFPRTANEIIRKLIQRDYAGDPPVSIVGESYLPLGTNSVGTVIEQIRAAQPDVIFNTINGDTNVAFFRALRQAGITSAQVPTVSFSLSEAELPALGDTAVGDYAAWNYLEALPSEENKRFLSRLGEHRAGRAVSVSDPMEAAYVGVHLWAQAAQEAGDPRPKAVRAHLGGQEWAAPEGRVKIDPATQHLWKAFRLGRVTAAHRLAIERDDKAMIPPEPFPDLGVSRSQWETFLERWQAKWGGRWEAPSR